MELNKKQKVIILALSIITIIFLSAYLSIFFTSHTTLFKVRSELNGESSPQIRVYYNNVLGTKFDINNRYIIYTIKLKISGIAAGMYVYPPDNTQYSWQLGDSLFDGISRPKSISVDFTGAINRIAISTWTSIHIYFTLEIRLTYYEIDWIYGVLIATYVIFCVILVVLLGKYSEKDNFIKRTLQSFKSKKT